MNKLLFIFLFSAITAHADYGPPGPLRSTIRLGGNWQPQRNVKNQNEKSQEIRSSLEFIFPLYEGEHNSWTLTPSAEQLHNRETIAIPGSTASIPKQLWKAGLNLGFNRKLESRKTFNLDTRIESESDKPFQSLAETDFQINANWRIPTDNFGSAWTYYLNFNTGRSFLPGIPLPGFSYFWNASEEWKWVFGIPFLSMIWRPHSKILMNATVIAPHIVQARLAYLLFGPAQAYAQFKYGLENWRLADRSNKKDFLFYRDAQASIGAIWPLAPSFLADISGEYHFLRRYSLGEKISKTGAKKVFLPNVPALNLKLTYRF